MDRCVVCDQPVDKNDMHWVCNRGHGDEGEFEADGEGPVYICETCMDAFLLCRRRDND